MTENNKSCPYCFYGWDNVAGEECVFCRGTGDMFYRWGSNPDED